MFLDNVLKDRNFLWKFVKSKRGREPPAKVTADARECHFKNLYQAKPGDDNILVTEPHGSHDYLAFQANPNTSYNWPITENEVCDAISAAKLNKAPGIDGITNEVLRAPSIMLTRYLFLLFTVCFSRAQIPDEWRHCQIIPLYKNKGSITDPNKYRGIALLTNLYKMYTNIICRRLYVWCDEFAILPDSQHGFRLQRSTKTAIQDLTYDIKSCISSKTPFFFVDFEKAFDCVSRKKLMLKLSKLGCPSQSLAVLTDIYKDTQIQVGLGDSLTRKIKQTRGVPQGDQLSPLLFSIFLADLSNYLENSHCTVIFYADDLALGSNDPQNAINKLSLYCEHNDVSVNIEKTVVQVFQNAGRNRQIDFFYRNVPLTYTQCFVYLGLALSTRLSSYPQIERNMKNVGKNIGALNKTTPIRKFDFEPASRLLKSVYHSA